MPPGKLRASPTGPSCAWGTRISKPGFTYNGITNGRYNASKDRDEQRRAEAFVAGVQQVFDDQGRCLQEGIEKRIRGVATNLIDYIHSNICPRVALEQLVREGTVRRIA